VLELIKQDFDGSVVELIESAEGSAGKLVNLLAHHFDAFRDESRFDGKQVRILKRAQIFVADLWAAFGGEGYGDFDDIDDITMFAGKSTRARLQHSLTKRRLSSTTNAPHTRLPYLQPTA